MPLPRSERRSAWLPLVLAGVLIGLPVGYVLSCGPMALLATKGWIGGRTWEVAYTPAWPTGPMSDIEKLSIALKEARHT